MKRIALALFVLSGWACSQQPVAQPCQRVEADPPAAVRFVAMNELEVPFQSWGCPSLNADAFLDLEDFRILSVDGTVNVFFVTDPENEISAIGGTAVRGNRVDLPIEPIEAGQVRIAVPDPAIEWSIQLRILTPTDRVAYYDIVLAPPG